MLIDTIKPFKQEIPTSGNGDVSIFYRLAKAKQQQLGLDSLENGFADLQLRIWYDFSLVRERKLVVITNKAENWQATVYNLQVDWNGRTETIVSKQIKNVTPKSGWTPFSTRLLALKIASLPDDSNVPGYGLGMDGNTYNVEVATKNQYRFYGYWEPQHYQDRFWQAKNMAAILTLLKEELGV